MFDALASRTEVRALKYCDLIFSLLYFFPFLFLIKCLSQLSCQHQSLSFVWSVTVYYMSKCTGTHAQKVLYLLKVVVLYLWAGSWGCNGCTRENGGFPAQEEQRLVFFGPCQWVQAQMIPPPPCKNKVEGKIVGSSCILPIKRYFLVLGTCITWTLTSGCCELLISFTHTHTHKCVYIYMYVCMYVVFILFSPCFIFGMSQMFFYFLKVLCTVYASKSITQVLSYPVSWI